MLAFPFLTDSPAPQRSKSAVFARYFAVQGALSPPERALVRRLLARQWGEATPAQALLCLSLFPSHSNPPTASLDLLAFDLEPDDRLAVVRQWEANASVKEANALCRVLDGDFGPKGRFLGACAWLCSASQHALQAFLRAQGLPKALSGRVQTPGKKGCTGFFLHSELFPKAMGKPTSAEEAVTCLFGG